ncbi:MAG: glycoside hydrolase family 16 protein [Tenericutes bacterium]|jgi:beta-glucanase (GH16 family)|nr:glycoside hydrolase family 16 protein [Mycoplasmatota bacterium]
MKELIIDFTKEQQLNSNIWNIAIGDKWSNNEAQHYIDSKDNLFFNEDGLVIQATKKDDIIRSARIHTKDKFYFQYGKGEIVAKVPSGKGTWPALWMMPQNNEFGHWPKSGEIDIMEHTGNQKDLLYLCIHTEKYNHIKKDQYYYTVQKENIADHFHTYGFEWTPESITYFIDGKKEHTYVKGEGEKDSTHKGWPFNQPFYLIMNLAIGGSLGGKIDKDMFPQQFVIQSIKIQEK